MKRAILLTSILVAPALLVFDFWLARIVGDWWNETYPTPTGGAGFFVGFFFWLALFGSQAVVATRLAEEGEN